MFPRSSQVASEIHHLLSEMIAREINPTQFGLVTITDVLVTDGLETARVYVSTMQMRDERCEAKEPAEQDPKRSTPMAKSVESDFAGGERSPFSKQMRDERSPNLNQDIVDFLNRKKGHFHHLLKKRLSMRKIPELQFIYDISADVYEKLDQA